MTANTNRLLVVAATIAALIVPVQARPDAGGGAGWVSPVESAIPRWLAASEPAAEDIEPAAGGEMIIASAPRKVETPALTPSAPAGVRLGAFESVAISAGSLPSAQKWRSVTGSSHALFFKGECSAPAAKDCHGGIADQLRAVRDAAEGKSGVAALRVVNAGVNAAVVYQSDRRTWGKGDYWATPAQVAAKGVGDCEDYAITKMWILRSLGFAPEQLQLVVLEDVSKSLYHAVLVVHVKGQRYVLDNLSSRVSIDTDNTTYMPIMSFVANKSYVHGFEMKRSNVASMNGDLASAAPGEGV